MKNGKLLALAAGEFDVLLTGSVAYFAPGGYAKVLLPLMYEGQ